MKQTTKRFLAFGLMLVMVLGTITFVTADPEPVSEIVPKDNSDITDIYRYAIGTETDIGSLPFDLTLAEQVDGLTSIEDSVNNCGKDETCPLFQYNDVDPNAWYHDGFHYYIVKDCITKTTPVTLSPDDAITRGEMVTLLWKIAGSPIVDAEMKFVDVPETMYCYDAVCWAASSGVVTGYDNIHFGPNDTLTRDMLATVLYQYAQKIEGKGFTGDWMFLLSYKDRNKIAMWAYEGVAWCTTNHIVQGHDNFFNPLDIAHKNEAINILYNYEMTQKEE